MMTLSKLYSSIDIIKKLNQFYYLYHLSRLLYTKIKIEEILFGFNVSLSSLFNLIWIYKQKIQSINDGGGSVASSSAVSVQPNSNVQGSGYKVNTGIGNATTPVNNQSSENWSTFESGMTKINLLSNFKLTLLKKN